MPLAKTLQSSLGLPPGIVITDSVEISCVQIVWVWKTATRLIRGMGSLGLGQQEKTLREVVAAIYTYI